MITYTKTTPDRMLQLRYQVLRPSFSITEVIFPEDQDKETRHYGVFEQLERIICCVTLVHSTWTEKIACGSGR